MWQSQENSISSFWLYLMRKSNIFCLHLHFTLVNICTELAAIDSSWKREKKTATKYGSKGSLLLSLEMKNEKRKNCFNFGVVYIASGCMPSVPEEKNALNWNVMLRDDRNKKNVKREKNNNSKHAQPIFNCKCLQITRNENETKILVYLNA